MPDFSAAQQKLAQARTDSAAAQSAASLAAQAHKAAAAARDRFARSLDRRDQAAIARMEQLNAQARNAAAEAARSGAAARQAAAAAFAALGEFAAFTDPRQNIGRLSDASPFVLFPIRLETRFKQISRGDVVRHQLWVRIYPDDISIDTFEEALSATELANAQRYWQGIWRAGGIEDDVRAAWRSLVAAHGSSRAGYIVDSYQPSNLPAPVKATRADEILVIAAQTVLAPGEAAAISAYWQAVWLADGDGTQVQAARAALETALGGARAGELVAAYRPFNLSDRPAPPQQKNAVAVSVAFVIFPPDPATRQSPWTQAPAVRHFPERFVVLGFNGGEQTLAAMGGVITLPLHVGPDPSVDVKIDPDAAIHPQGGDLFFPDALKWMVDFERAVAAGMGIVIDLTPAQAETGFDRLLVLGLQLSARHVDGQAALEEMLHHHAVGRSGLTLVRQGTVTHNTTGKGTGYTRLDNAEQSFDDRKNAPLFTPTADPMQKRDGQWLAELLGIDPNLLTRVHASGGTDQMCVRAMQRALWPATLGYWMDKLLAPVFSDEAVANTRWFFTHFVSGCGPVPAIRVGGQPYGILPTTAFSRIRWLDAARTGVRRADPQRAFLRALFALIRAVDADWSTMAANAAYVGKDDDRRDAHQLLLDVVGLHPSSVDFSSRDAESLSQLVNTVNLWGLGPDFVQAFALAQQDAAAGLLARLGYRGPEPDILQHFFLEQANPVTEAIDDRPLSETDPIRAYASGNRNYIRWLIEAANTSLDAVRLEEGFINDATPRALLYLYLRHALMLGYYDASYDLHKSAGILTTVQLAAMKPEPRFVHVAEAAAGGAPSESRFAALYKSEPRITGSPTLRVSDYITLNLASLIQAQRLREQLAALGVLADAPTAQLERAFAEHIDTCTHRLDAWQLGLVNYQLQQMRYGGGKGAQTGAYLGCYAWLENLRPDATGLVAARIADDVAPSFNGAAPIMHDPANGGYVHAPSLTHARTAAVLRSGYLANASAANPQTMKVNLSSDRVRLALSLLEGVRNGQSLGALLGYRFERELHDDHGLAEVDQFIYPLRKAFPLVADALAPTKTPPDVPIEAIEARNVIDGRKLVTHLNTTNQTTYPFGLAALPHADATATTAISDAANRLRDVFDAISDLALAEGVHQAAQGNFERIGATLNAYSSGNFPPDPQVVQTGPTGNALTHRVAVHFPVGLAAPAGATPRARAEPALDAFIASLLPPLERIGCVVTWTDPGGAARTQDVTLADLAVRPIDVVALVKPDQVQAMTELDDRVLRFVLATAAPRPDVALKIAYMTAPAGKLSVFAVTALVRSINALVIGARPLRATDAMLHNDARPDQDASVFADVARISAPKADLDTLSNDIGSFLGIVAPLIADRVANRAAISAGIDGLIDTGVALMERAARFNVPQSGWGFAYAWRHRAVADLLAQVRALVTRWDAKLADFDARVATYDALPAATDDAERFKALHVAEIVIVATVDPPPATPAALRALLDTKRTDFQTRRDGFAAVLASAGTGFAGFLAATSALLPITPFDREPFDLAPFGDRAIVMAEDLAAKLQGHLAAIDKKRDATQTALDNAAAATSQRAQVAAVEAAAKALLGDEFRIIPEFGLMPTQADEWANAVGESSGGALLNYLTTSGVDLPVEEWLCGAARVRPMLRAFEATLALTGALGGTEPSLLPIQLPYQAGAPWLALQFPPDYEITSDRLLYTAYYMTPFDKTARQCGLLLDEWTEVIPATTRTTGITFNFNRPDNEPPQAILLVTPASATGHWEWADLVGALNETLDLAKMRAVEPTQLDVTPYAPLLPATVMAATSYGISITTSLAAANGVFANLQVAPHG